MPRKPPRFEHPRFSSEPYSVRLLEFHIAQRTWRNVYDEVVSNEDLANLVFRTVILHDH